MAKLPLYHLVNTELSKELILTKPTQLKRMKRSISSLIDFNRIDEIQHSAFPPWGEDLPYSVNVDKSSKDKSADNHRIILKNTKNAESTSIYTNSAFGE